MFADTITVVMTDGRFINGVPHAPGERVKVTPAEAHEIVANGWARFSSPDDAERARQAFVEQQQRIIAALPGSRMGVSSSPWQKVQP